MTALPHDELLNYLVRMVVPMRREFGRTLDVSQFMRDKAYAYEILAEASRSRDPRLLDYVRHVERSLHSPRLRAPDGDSKPPEPVADSPPPSGFTHSQLYAEDGHRLTADELRDKVKKKYTGGLR